MRPQGKDSRHGRQGRSASPSGAWRCLRRGVVIFVHLLPARAKGRGEIRSVLRLVRHEPRDICSGLGPGCQAVSRHPSGLWPSKPRGWVRCVWGLASPDTGSCDPCPGVGVPCPVRWRYVHGGWSPVPPKVGKPPPGPARLLLEGVANGTKRELRPGSQWLAQGKGAQERK